MSRLLPVVAVMALISATQASACLPEGETLPVSAPEDYFAWDDDKRFDWFIAEYREHCQVDSLEGKGVEVSMVHATWMKRESRIAIAASKRRVAEMTEKLFDRANREAE